MAMAVASLGASVGGALGMAGPLTYGTSLAIGAGTIVAGGGLLYGATKMMSGMQPKMPEVPSGGQLPETPTIEQAREDSREDTLDLLRKKRAGTTLTTPQGLLSTSDTSKKILLGA